MGEKNINRIHHPTVNKVNSITPDEARKWLSGKKTGEYTLLDVRQPEEYNEGHIPGAQLIPLDELLDKIDELDHEKPVITYCRIGGRSSSAASLLMSHDFKEANNIKGGIEAWNGYVAVGEYETGMSLLEGRETLEDLISLAYVLEDGTRLFYERVKERFKDGEVKDLFSELIQAEKKHKASIVDMYKKMKGGVNQDNIVRDENLKDVMEGGMPLQDIFNWLDDEERSLRDVLELSMQSEINSLDLYTKIINEIKDEDSKAVYKAIIEEEKKHLSKMSELLSSKLKN